MLGRRLLLLGGCISRGLGGKWSSRAPAGARNPRRHHNPRPGSRVLSLLVLNPALDVLVLFVRIELD